MTRDLITVANGASTTDALLELDPRLRSPYTKRAYRRDLAGFREWGGGQLPTKLTVEAYMADLLAQGKSPATVNRTLASIRWLARKGVDMARENPTLSDRDRAWYIGQLTAVREVKNIPSDGRPLRGRAVASGELAALMGACKGDRPADVRDAAIIALAWTVGPRRSEIAHLDVSDVEPIEGGYQVTITKGKGGKTRTVYLGNGAADALADWLAVRGDSPGPVFLAITKGNEIQREPYTYTKGGQTFTVEPGLSAEALAQVLDKRAEQAGVKSLSWHDLRRTVAGDLLDDGTDIATVARVLGHASVQTTARYDRRDSRAVQKALQARHVPYRRRTSGGHDEL